MSIKLSDYVMQFLADKGVKHVFMLPGGGAMHLNDSLGRRTDIEYCCFLHEQALGIAAEAYGQYSNFPGVALVTSGPGGTNAVTAVAAAYIDSTPCVFISGQAKRADLKGASGVRQMGSQEVDIVSIVSSVTKYAAMVLEPDDIRYHLEKAWHAATTGRTGPVWLDIPLDVQAAQIDESALRRFVPDADLGGVQSVISAVDRFTALLNDSKRPAVLVGNGVKLAGAQDAVLQFVETNQIPVLLTWKTVDVLDHDHPLNFQSPGIMGCRSANFIVQNCDLLLILGSRLDPSITAFNSAAFGKHATKVIVDVDQAEVRKLAGIDLPVIADVRRFMELLSERQPEIKVHQRGEWLAYCRKLKRRYPVVLDSYSDDLDGVNLYYFSDQLFRQLTADDNITLESSGAAGEVPYQAMRIKKGQKVRNAAGLGAMGFGLPYAIGACVATEGRRTILVNGDGAFQLNIQELQTAVRLKLPLKMFILDNNGYGSIMATQRNMFGGFYVGADPSSGLTLPDICAVARAYGIRTEEAASHHELSGAISRTLAGDDLALCRVKITPKHVTAPRVQSMKTAEGGMISKPLEDMWPYLPEEEVKANMIADESKEA